MTREPSTVTPAVLTTREAAVYLSISLPTLFRLLKAGELPHFRLGRLVRFRPEDLDAFLESKVTKTWTEYEPPPAAAAEKPTPPPAGKRTSGTKKSPQTRTMGHKRTGGRP